MRYLADGHAASVQPVRQCAWCLRIVEIGGEYGGAPLSRKLHEATHGICPTCKSQALESLES